MARLYPSRMMSAPLLEQLIEALRVLPGVGQKTAQRMAYHLLEREREGGEKLSALLAQAMERIEKEAIRMGVLVEDLLSLARLDERRVDRQRLAAAVFGFEADGLEQFLHHRLQSSRTDILERLIDLGGDAGERADAVVGEGDVHLLGRQQSLILLG